ncbi:MAG: hypothetical protein O2954_01975 [bacterium]|nr:hypothetical protein [bacterium]
MKRTLIATAAVFVAWSILDFLIHAVILESAYAATSQLWRPMEEMKMGVMYITTFITAFSFASIYTKFFAKQNLFTGLKYGLWFGLAAGVSMGYGTYAVMPIPYYLAFTWFLGTLVECAVGGILLGLLVKDE